MTQRYRSKDECAHVHWPRAADRLSYLPRIPSSPSSARAPHQRHSNVEPARAARAAAHVLVVHDDCAHNVARAKCVRVCGAGGGAESAPRLQQCHLRVARRLWAASHLRRRNAADGAVLLLSVLLPHGLQVVGSRVLVQAVHVAHAGQDGSLGIARVLLQLRRLHSERRAQHESARERGTSGRV